MSEKLTEAEVQWAMKMVDLAGLDPAPGTTLRECAEALLRSDELAERVAREREAVLDEAGYAKRKRDEFSADRRDQIIEALSWWEDDSGRWGYDRAETVLRAHEIEWSGDLRATTQDGEAT